MSHRPLHRDIVDRAAIGPPDQEKTGNGLRQQLIDQVKREPVEGEDKGRGYEYLKNAYIPVDDDELDVVAIERSHTIETRSKSTRSFRASKLTRDISTTLTTSCRTTKSGATHLR